MALDLAPGRISIVILNIALPVPIFRTFDYLPPENFNTGQLDPGVRVVVPFGRQTKVGVLVGVSSDSSVELSLLKRVKDVLDQRSLISEVDLQILHWASEYYHHPLGEVLASAFPVLLRKGKAAVLASEPFFRVSKGGKKITDQDMKKTPKQAVVLNTIRAHPEGINRKRLKELVKNCERPVRELIQKGWIEVFDEIEPRPSVEKLALSSPEFSLNKAQKTAIEGVAKSLGKFGVYLLEGVTGSGKTEVYLRLIEKTLRRGEQAMVLLPEISLTPQTEARFRERFPVPIAIFHSALTETDRLHAWLQVQQGRASILLGTRSAVFAPMEKPGLIILDEEHDTSFKQQEGFRFSARDFAILRAKKLSIPVLLGSATPSLESLRNVQLKRYHLLSLPERAGQASHPKLKILDIRNQQLTEGFSSQLVQEIEKAIGRKEQVLLFLNRRGYAPTLICHSCGWVAKCKNCDSNMVIHLKAQQLRCHHCGHSVKVVSQCPHCATADLRSLGLGTERVEGALNVLFPSARTVRIDRDSTRRKGTLESILDRIGNDEIDIILGTQMLAKGHHFPNVTLVGILDTDSGLFSTDFRAPERLAQLIVQVAGRAGREGKKGTVILQSRQPDHPILRSLVFGGYKEFSSNALKERRSARLPPFSYQALLRAEARIEKHPIQFLERVVLSSKHLKSNETLVLGPVPAPMTRRADHYRYQLLIQSAKRESLHEVLDLIVTSLSELQKGNRVRWSLDVDPVDLY